MNGAFSPAEGARGFFTAQVVNAQGGATTATLIVGRGGLGPNKSSKAVFVGISPDAVTSANKAKLPGRLLSY